MGLHLVALGHYFAVLLSGVLVQCLVLILAQNYAFEEGAHFVFGEVVGELAHLVEQINVLIEHH